MDLVGGIVCFLYFAGGESNFVPFCGEGSCYMGPNSWARTKDEEDWGCGRHILEFVVEVRRISSLD